MLSFVPVAVEGMSGVREVTVSADALVFRSDTGLTRISLVDTARFPRPRALRRLAFRWGMRPKWLPVGERDWCQPPGQQFFRFYSRPEVVVFVPESESEAYGTSLFRRIQDVLALGGFHTQDLA